MAEEIDILTARFDEFLEEHCYDEIEVLVNSYPSRKSLNVDFQVLERFDPTLADQLLRQPDLVKEAAEKALEAKGVLVFQDTALSDQKFEPHVRFFNLSDKSILIQDVGAKQVEKLVCLQGVVSKRAEVRPRVRIAFYKCKHCDATYKVPFTKKTLPLENCEQCKRKLLLNEEESYFVDIQRAEMQELLERLHGGAPASHIELLLEDDLVNKVIPGDTVEITGVLRIRLPPIKSKERSGVYLKYLDVMHIQSMQRDFEEVEVSKEEEQQIIDTSKDAAVFDKIVQSLAPAIYGNVEVKRAIALQLFGGTPNKILPEGGRIRSDIHILLIGDPGAAKTRFLQYVSDIAPKSIYVSGKSVSGVGLTASAEKDDLGDGGWVLKAGALVLASGGLASVDEFDKIDDNERAALHEVMESGTVSVAKAGIVARFKAQTSIIAAANPKFGRFDLNQPLANQFEVPPTLLSRFDLIFPIKDVMDEERDKALAEHILASHTAAGKKEGTQLMDDRRPLPEGFIRKYIAYARKNISPVLTKAATDRIKEYYVELRRMGQQAGAVPITPRQIEGLIRMSEASAKTRLSLKVDLSDAELAISLNEFVMRQIGMDKTTGRFDIDLIATGHSKSEADKFRQVLNIVEELQKQTDLVEVAKVVEEAKNQGIDERTVERIIEERLTKGDFYKPKPGYIKSVKRVG